MINKKKYYQMNKTNIKNKDLFYNFYRDHTNGGGTTPIETALTNLVFMKVSEKDFKIIPNDNENICLFDVVMYLNFVNDIIFGVVNNMEDDEIWVCTGTGERIIEKRIHL